MTTELAHLARGLRRLGATLLRAADTIGDRLLGGPPPFRVLDDRLESAQAGARAAALVDQGLAFRHADPVRYPVRTITHRIPGRGLSDPHTPAIGAARSGVRVVLSEPDNRWWAEPPIVPASLVLVEWSWTDAEAIESARQALVSGHDPEAVADALIAYLDRQAARQADPARCGPGVNPGVQWTCDPARCDRRDSCPLL